MRCAGTLLLAAALLSLCLLAGANAAIAPAWESADFELEALAGSQEAAAGLRLYSRVTGQIARRGDEWNLDLYRELGIDSAERAFRLGGLAYIAPQGSDADAPALANGQAQGGYKYYGEGCALSIMDEDGRVLSFTWDGSAYEPGPVFELGGLPGWSLTPEGEDMGLCSYTRQYAFDGERLAVLTVREPEVFGDPERFFVTVCSQNALLYAAELVLPGAGAYVWGRVYLEFV